MEECEVECVLVRAQSGNCCQPGLDDCVFMSCLKKYHGVFTYIRLWTVCQIFGYPEKRYFGGQMDNSTWAIWSSGKDSARTFHTLKKNKNHNVIGIFTTVNQKHNRVAMHGTRLTMLPF